MVDSRSIISSSPEATFELGEALGAELRPRDVVLLTGGLGAGKTLLTKGILNALEYDIDEVTSPSFTLVNLYKTHDLNVYHIDLWRSGEGDAAFSVGLDEILEDESGVVIIEWAEKLGDIYLDRPVYRIDLEGDGDEPRRITIRRTEQTPVASV
jgi:tRNA threonylcarbamoyladenosine biosynthesis protein TsaE